MTSLHYDGAGRLDSLATPMLPGMSFAYQRNENGNITAENSMRYTYDDLNRLKTWYDPSTNATTTYTFDADYNLTGASHNGATLKRFSFDAAERISNVGWAYDDNGNLTSDGNRTYAYDELNRLTSVADSSGATIARYTYDYANRRTSATGANGATTHFHYDDASANVVAETDGAGHTTATYAWAGSTPLSMTRGGATYYYHTNAHGDVLALTNASGDVVASYTYDPWGAPTSATGTVANPYRYAGYRYDSATGLYYLLNRYYSPESCRFITRDLLAGDAKQPGTMNHYAYCLGDPVNAADPSGLRSFSTEGAMAGLQCGALGLAAGMIAGEILGSAPVWLTYLAAGAGLILVGATGYAIGTAFMYYLGYDVPGMDDYHASAMAAAGAVGVLGLGAGAALGGRGGGAAGAAATDAAAVRPSTVPDFWMAKPANRGPGVKYLDPENPSGNNVRFDAGHVHVKSGGKTLGPDGRPVADKDPARHIPRDVWDSWREWNAP